MKCLFLVRTPFQAFVAKRIIMAEKPEAVDVWFVVKPWTQKAERYALDLTKVADRVFFESRKPGFFNAMGYYFRGAPRFVHEQTYDRIYCASYHTYYFRKLCHEAELRTFDDGAGSYLNGTEQLQTAWDLIDWTAPLKYTSERSVAHYAVRPDLPNFFPKEKIIPVNLGIEIGEGKEPLTIAVGQPFGDYLSPEQEAAVRERIKGLPYFPHPREAAPPAAIGGTDILEDYVAKKSQAHEITLIGGFSTALLTIPKVRKIYLDADRNEQRRAVMEMAGCEVEAI